MSGPVVEDDGYVGPQNGIRNFVEEMNFVSSSAKKLFISDLHTPGMIIDFLPARYPSKHPMDVLVQGRFTLDKIIRDSDVENFPESFLRTNHGTLIEHINTGYFFAVYQDEDELFQSMEIFDFEGSPLSPTNIEQAGYTTELHEWVEIAADSKGTRMGGIPLNPDGSKYDGPWPETYHDDGIMSFAGQFELPDGRYLHLFLNYDAEDFIYGWDVDDISDPYSCALVDGVPVTPAVTLRTGGERPVLRRNSAQKGTKKPKGVRKFQPFWMQDDEAPNDPRYAFLLQYTVDSIDGKADFGGVSEIDYYVFWNDRESKALIISQSF